MLFCQITMYLTDGGDLVNQHYRVGKKASQVQKKSLQSGEGGSQVEKKAEQS